LQSSNFEIFGNNIVYVKFTSVGALV